MFWNCYELTSIDLSNITTLYPVAFAGCSSLTGVINLPKLRTFGSRNINEAGYNYSGNQFSYCTGITEVHFGSDVMAGLKIDTMPSSLF